MITITQPEPETPAQRVSAYLLYTKIDHEEGRFVELSPARNPSEAQFLVKLEGVFAKAWLAGVSPESPGGPGNDD